MSYDVQCRRCNQRTFMANIVDLLKRNTNEFGNFICGHCKSTDTFIYRESALQERGETWKRWIKGVVQIDSGVETYSPYIFLTADSAGAQPNGLHFNYYKDTRSYPGGRLKHGHGPGGAPVLDIKDVFVIIGQLVSMGIFSKDEVKRFAAQL